MRTSRASLAAAYHATCYRITRQDGSFLETRIGTPCLELDALLKHSGAAHAALITAHNPYGIPLGTAANARRAARMDAWLAAFKARSLPAAGVPDEGSWAAERGRLILDVPPALADRVARIAGQLAWVSYSVAAAPSLRWTTHAVGSD